MKIIIGIGNPGEEYSGTRHNIGFEIVSEFAKLYGFSDFSLNKKFNAEIAKGSIDGKKIILVKPQTFVNLSGESVAKILEFYKLQPSDIIVVHDDLDIMLGKFKVSNSSSSAGHRGAQNIIDKLGTQNFQRLRIGIREERYGTPACPIDTHSFVLGKFSDEENEKNKSVSADIMKMLALIS